MLVNGNNTLKKIEKKIKSKLFQLKERSNDPHLPVWLAQYLLAVREISFFTSSVCMRLKVSHKKGHVLSHHTDPRVCGYVFSFNPLAISHKQVTTSHLWTNILAYFKMYLNTFYVFTSSCCPLVTCVPFSVLNYYENLALWNFVSSRFHFNNSVYTTWQKYFVTQGEGEGQVKFNKT